MNLQLDLCQISDQRTQINFDLLFQVVNIHEIIEKSFKLSLKEKRPTKERLLSNQRLRVGK